MGANSKIQWTTHTFNPWRGCVKVAAGCANCYAEAQSKRNPKTLGVWGPNGTRVVASEAMWREPVKWNKQAMVWPLHVELCRQTGVSHPILEWERRNSGTLPDPSLMRRPRVFCASLADVFEDWGGTVVDASGYVLHSGKAWGSSKVWVGVQDVYIGKNVVSLDDVRRRLFSLIDDTPNLDWLLLTKRPENVQRMWASRAGENAADVAVWSYRPNVWLGTSIACRADIANIDKLRECRDLVPVLFLSIEPLIEDLGKLDLTGIDWVIVGGESGHGARPCNVAWIRSIVAQCKAAGVTCFVKQVGANAWLEPRELESRRRQPNYVPLRDHKGGNPAEWPEDLRVQQLPEVGRDHGKR